MSHPSLGRALAQQALKAGYRVALTARDVHSADLGAHFRAISARAGAADSAAG
jgi:NAD(P)-dependent dehydrogenase (short-subunit alcohol dehydrogenase family)